jgi:hypothetical protein
VQNADKIIVVQGGVLAEEGSHSQLIEAGGLYRKMVNKQRLGNSSASVRGDPSLSKLPASLAARTPPQHMAMSAEHDEMLALDSPAQMAADTYRLITKQEAAAASGQQERKSSWSVMRAMKRYMGQESRCILVGTVSAAVTGLMFPAFAMCLGFLVWIYIVYIEKCIK